MPDNPNRLRRWGSYLFVALVASVVTLIWAANRWIPLETPLPPLLTGLPGGIPNESRAFADRMSERFPVGSAEGDMIRELWLEGFQPNDLSTAQRKVRYDSFGHQLVCRTIATVSWTTNTAGRIASIVANADTACS